MSDRQTEIAPPPGCPVSAYDFYDEANLADPHPGNKILREQGGVVWLTRERVFALPRYEMTRTALGDWRRFSSAKGVMLNEIMNGFMQGTLLCSDPPAHDVKRKVIMEPLTPTALRAIRSEITAEAEALTDELCGRREFNAAVDLAEPLPLAIVAKRVGLPPVKREGQLRWTKASFDCIGPGDRERTQAALRILPEIGGFVGSNAAREQIDPDSWLGGLYRAADAGLIAHAECGPMSIDYVGPSLDTTISALSSAVWLFATHPTQWKSVRENPALIPNAINEIVRLETPIQGWTRYVTESVELGGVQLPPGSRVLVMFGSANRDERKWNDPERFDVNRQVSDHMGFGHGEHACAGANLARLEIMAMLNALAAKVERFELVGEAVREVTQATRGWANIPVRVHLA